MLPVEIRKRSPVLPLVSLHFLVSSPIICEMYFQALTISVFPLNLGIIFHSKVFFSKQISFLSKSCFCSFCNPRWPTTTYCYNCCCQSSWLVDYKLHYCNCHFVHLPKLLPILRSASYASTQNSVSEYSHIAPILQSSSITLICSSIHSSLHIPNRFLSSLLFLSGIFLPLDLPHLVTKLLSCPCLLPSSTNL